MLASNTIWAKLVKDSKKRGCFFDALKDKDLAETVRLATKVKPLLCEKKGLLGARLCCLTVYDGF